MWAILWRLLPCSLKTLLCSLDFHLSTGVDAQTLPLIPAKDAGEVLAKESEKYDPKVPPVKSNHSLLVFQPQITTDVQREIEPPYAPKVEECYYQINWPQAVLQRWATEKSNQEKNLNLVFSQGQTFTSREPEAKKRDHQESTETASQPQCSDD